MLPEQLIYLIGHDGHGDVMSYPNTYTKWVSKIKRSVKC